MCVPLGRPAQQMAGVPRCTVLVGNYCTLHTSRNVAGIYCLSDVICNSLFWVYAVSCVSRSWACRTAWRGHNIWFRSPGWCSFPPAPPPPDFALSEPLPGGLQGWLRAVSDIRTRGCFAAARELQEEEIGGQQDWRDGRAVAA